MGDAIAEPISNKQTQQIKLTSEQQAVVNHDHGPALVFAVAGAGKTTAMVHRIERLVREEVFPPEKILATSFGKMNERDLLEALQRWPHCRRVRVRTLHALGFEIVRSAWRKGLLPEINLNGNHDTQSLNHEILFRAISQARKMDVDYARELFDFDQQDFLDYVGSCKNNLAYAGKQRLEIPQAYRQLTMQAESPSSELHWYLDLYKLFEEERLRMGAITFDDMLLSAWELLVKFPEVLSAVQDAFDCVLVDEFQDINLVQAEMLDLITQPQRNYMAIGDDDQTVYEWRGASPRYILNFRGRYNARRFLISDNFRCPAEALTLANEDIKHNRKREKKRLHLTRGFNGQVYRHTAGSLEMMGDYIAGKTLAAQANGVSLDDMAVLVRLNGQTAAIEQALISQNIPYRVNKRFFEQREIKTLINYGRLAWFEKRLRDGGAPIDNERAKQKLLDAWLDICNRPKRYIPMEVKAEINQALRRQERPISDSIRRVTGRLQNRRLVDKLESLAGALHWLAGQLDKDAHRALKSLEERLDYKIFLIDSSSNPQIGEVRAAGVDAFITYARNEETLADFLRHVNELDKKTLEQNPQEPAVTLSTIHRAKGLEWDMVFIPQCDDHIMPFERGYDPNIEEERRLLYVAITRTRRVLHMITIKDQAVSRFLRQAKWGTTVTDVKKLHQILDNPPEEWSAAEVLDMTRAIQRYELRGYFLAWWDIPQEKQQAIARRMLDFYTAVRQKNLLAQLSLRETHFTWWQQLVPAYAASEPVDFPGLADYLPRPIVKGEPPPGRKRPGSDIVIDTLMKGMWVLCDGGWGQINRILDDENNQLVMADRGDKQITLEITLRPEHDALRAVIDVAAAKIRFLYVQRIYSCNKCHQFTSAKHTIITKGHTNAAHDGRGAGFIPDRKTEMKLKILKFAASKPKNELG